MKNPIRLIWECDACKDVVISYSSISHDMNTCDCGYSSVDLEEDYMRTSGAISEISRKQRINGKWQNLKS